MALDRLVVYVQRKFQEFSVVDEVGQRVDAGLVLSAEQKLVRLGYDLAPL
jgi:hypothetical protein